MTTYTLTKDELLTLAHILRTPKDKVVLTGGGMGHDRRSVVTFRVNSASYTLRGDAADAILSCLHL